MRYSDHNMIHLESPDHLTDQAFMDLCQANPLLRLERTADGEVEAMSPSGTESGCRDLDLGGQIGEWNRRTKLGFAFGSSAGFRLPNSAIRSPDASWVERPRYVALSRAERETFAPLCPDFVVEILSPSDDRITLQTKLREYISQGARLGWLIDPFQREVEIYRPGQEAELLSRPATLSGEDVLPGLVVDLSEILNG